MSYEPHSVAEVSNLLLLWAKRPGPGMALVEFVSEYARQAVFQQVSVGMGQPIPELVFESTGDLEPDVRGLVSTLRAEKSPLVSVRGIADAFPGPELRRRVLGLLNFLRESISEYSGKQIWWVTPDVGKLLAQCAPDWHSWFHPRLMLLEETVVSAPEVPQVNPATLPKPQADAIVADARTRLAAGAHNANSAERWRQLADPAIVALQQAGDPTAATALREEFLDTIYGESRDATRQAQIRKDLSRLMAARFYSAAASLAGDGEELAVLSASDDRRREALLQVALSKAQSGQLVGAERMFEALADDLGARVAEGRVELENDLAGALINRGNALQVLGRLTEAVEAYDRAIAILGRLVGAGRVEVLPDLGKALANRGMVAAAQSDTEAACRDFLAAREAFLSAQSDGHQAVEPLLVQVNELLAETGWQPMS